MTHTLIIDADPIIYAAGFAAQGSTYEYVLEHADGRMEQYASADGNAALKYLREHKPTVLDKQVHVEAKPESFARQCAKTQLEAIIKAVKQRFETTDLNVEIYLSGPGNYRYNIATIAPYKGDRPPPPVHYQVLRNYLSERWGAVVISGMEADDKVSIRIRELTADGEPCCLATIDKDLDQVPGLHYNYQKHAFYVVDEWDAEWTFWKQCLSGDSTDNIPGCYRLGEAKADKILTDCWEQWEDKNNREAWLEEVWWEIVRQYAKNMNTYPERYPKGMLSEDAALETARLVFMQHYEGQLWNPPGVPHAEVSSLPPR